MIAWLVVIALSVAALFASAAHYWPVATTAVSGATGLTFIVLALRDRSAAARRSTSLSSTGAATSRCMGLVWLWGSVSIFVIYVFVLRWPEWWQFCLAFGAAGALCLGYAALLERDAHAGRDDRTMLALGRYLAIGQLIGMIVTIVGLAIDPDKEFLWIKEGDWAGNIICLFGAGTLGVITAHALLTDKQPD